MGRRNHLPSFHNDWSKPWINLPCLGSFVQIYTFILLWYQWICFYLSSCSYIWMQSYFLYSLSNYQFRHAVPCSWSQFNVQQWFLYCQEVSSTTLYQHMPSIGFHDKTSLGWKFLVVLHGTKHLKVCLPCWNKKEKTLISLTSHFCCLSTKWCQESLQEFVDLLVPFIFPNHYFQIFFS